MICIGIDAHLPNTVLLAFSNICKSDNARRRLIAFVVFDYLWLLISKNSDTGVTSSKINSDCCSLRHDFEISRLLLCKVSLANSALRGRASLALQASMKLYIFKPLGIFPLQKKRHVRRCE